MKRPYSGESWTRFKELMQKLTKRSAIVEARSQLNEDNIAELQPAVEELQETVEKINDYTTGINLIRGSRDFTVGTKKFEFVNGFYDGFVIPSTCRLYVDSDGYTVANLKLSGSNTDQWRMIFTNYFNGFKKGDWLTIGFDIMVDDVSVLDNDNILLIDVTDYDKSSPINRWTFYLKNYVDSPENENWYHIEQRVQVTGNVTDNTYAHIRIQLPRNGSINVKKMCCYVGNINHPIWSQSPFDVILNQTDFDDKLDSIIDRFDSINDETTGINLLRGTRDFTLGSDRYLSSYNYLDGFTNNTGFISYKDVDGFTVFEKTNTQAAFSRISTSVIKDVDKESYYTIFFEFMTENVTTLTNELGGVYLGTFFLYTNDGKENKYKDLYSKAHFGIQNTENGKWYKAVYYLKFEDMSYTTNGPHSDDYSSMYAIFSPTAREAGTTKFRKMGVYKGKIENPVWSASPFDIDYINDETTGINLLKGTRDIYLTTNLYNDSGFGADGFVVVPNYQPYVNFSKDENGFGIVSISRSGLSASAYTSIRSSVIPLSSKSIGDIYTVSFDVMVDDINSLDLNGIGYVELYNFDNKTRITGKDLYLSDGGITPVSGKWARVVFDYTVPESAIDNSGIILYLQVPRNGSVNFKKPCIYKGRINNPIWSASPFDAASSYDFNELFGPSKVEKMLKAGDDLDKLLEYGKYACYTYSIVTQLLNKPKDLETAFVLYVETANGQSNTRRQRLIALNSQKQSNPRVFIRYKQDGINGDEWFEWEETYTYTTIRPIEGGGTGGKTLEEAQTNLKIFNTKNTAAISDSNSTNDGYSVFGPNTANVPISGAYGVIEQIRNSSGPWLMQRASTTSGNGPLEFIRSNINNSGWSSWDEILTKKHYPYNPGLYKGRSIADIFKNEIGSDHIANWLSSRVSQGNFEGLNIGDWVDINCDGTTMRYYIAGIDTYYKTGYYETPHHIIMVPNKPWTLSEAKDGSYATGLMPTSKTAIAWNTENSNNGTSETQSPYMASNLHKWEIEVMLPRFPQEWQDVMYDRMVYLETRYSASSTLTDSTGASWVQMGKIWSPSEVEMTGRSDNCSGKYSCAGDCQFPFFAQAKDIVIGDSKWLRSVGSNSAATACIINSYGVSTTNNVTKPVKPYPCFMIS